VKGFIDLYVGDDMYAIYLFPVYILYCLHRQCEQSLGW